MGHLSPELPEEELSPLTQQVLRQKAVRRSRLAALPFSEKVKILERLRDTAVEMHAAAIRAGVRRG
jgi:hypothetical protein